MMQQIDTLTKLEWVQVFIVSSLFKRIMKATGPAQVIQRASQATAVILEIDSHYRNPIGYLMTYTDLILQISQYIWMELTRVIMLLTRRYVCRRPIQQSQIVILIRISLISDVLMVCLNSEVAKITHRVCHIIDTAKELQKSGQGHTGIVNAGVFAFPVTMVPDYKKIEGCIYVSDVSRL